MVWSLSNGADSNQIYRILINLKKKLILTGIPPDSIERGNKNTKKTQGFVFFKLLLAGSRLRNLHSCTYRLVPMEEKERLRG